MSRERYAVSAQCSSCHADVEWRGRFLGAAAGALCLTERGELAVRLHDVHRCAACGGDEVEICARDLSRLH